MSERAKAQASPSIEELIPGFGSFMDGLAAHLQEHAPYFVEDCARVMADRQVDYSADIAALALNTASAAASTKPITREGE